MSILLLVTLTIGKVKFIESRSFQIAKFIKYYFEFSPEDFEMNEEPEFGSTIIHLRGRVLNLINDSEYLRQFNQSSGKNPITAATITKTN